MQHSPLEIKEKLLKAVDKEYNVLDMGTVVEVITILERTPITKEVLESTRLGKYVNELRRKTTNGALARRAKELVRQWRHLIAQPEGSPSTSSSRLRNGLVPSTHLGGTLSPGLPPSVSNLPPKPSISPPLNSGSTASVANIPVSPAISVASSGRSSSPSLQIQQSSAPARHNVKKHTACPLSPVAFNSQSRTRLIPRPESPGLSLTQVNQVLASDSVPKTHVANKRLRKDVSPSAISCKKLGQTNGGLVNNNDLDVACPSVDIVEECSRDSLGATSDHGSVTYQTESHALLQNEVPQDNGLHSKSSAHKRHRKVTTKGAKTKNSFSESSSHPSVEDIVKEKIASIARIPKVKTTQELLADLQAKTVPSEDHVSVNSMPTGSRTSLSNCTIPSKHGSPTDALEISRNKTEHIAKFLRSHSALQELHRDQTVSELPKSFNEGLSMPPKTTENSAVSRFSTGVPLSSNDIFHLEKSVSSKSINNAPSSVQGCVNEEVTNILACLPPIKYDEIKWNDEQDSVCKVTTPEETEHLVERLFTENIEGISGNYSNQTSGDMFREWHETVVRPSYQEDLLSILPYVIID